MPNTKLRASCDACHFAKVKCEKTGQGCRRCSSLQETCCFSPALPRHYQRRKRQKSSTDIDNAQSVPTADSTISSSIPSEDGHTMLIPPDTGPETWNIPGFAGLSPSPTSNEALDIFSNSIAASSWPDLAPGSGGELCPLPRLDHQIFSLNNLYDSPNNTATAPTTATTTSVTTPQSHVTTSGSSRAASSSDATTPASNPSLFEPLNLSPPPNTTRSHHDDHTKRCTCTTHLLAAMKHIQAHAEQAEPALDSTLCANRAAAEECTRVLRSSCHTSHDAVCSSSCWYIICGLLEIMLAGYRRAVESFCRRLDHQEKKYDGSPSDLGDDEDGLGESGLAGLQLRLGNFTVEKRDQVMYTRRIVAREIERLKKVLGNAKEGGGDGEEVDRMLRRRLVRKCDDAVRDVMA